MERKKERAKKGNSPSGEVRPERQLTACSLDLFNRAASQIQKIKKQFRWSICKILFPAYYCRWGVEKGYRSVTVYAGKYVVNVFKNWWEVSYYIYGDEKTVNITRSIYSEDEGIEL